MKKASSPFRLRLWIIILVGLALLAASQTRVAQGLIDGTHLVDVLFRVDAEIMTKTPASQYYRAMYWRHNDELIQIYIYNHPEKFDHFIEVSVLFLPNLEALLDGRGATVRITGKQVDSLQAELEWLASVGSPALRDDIVKEMKRFSLSEFVGLTMTEAFEKINTGWTPGE
jgi:hypothetical protein